MPALDISYEIDDDYIPPISLSFTCLYRNLSHAAKKVEIGGIRSVPGCRRVYLPVLTSITVIASALVYN